jgi:hypothetical protein
LRCVKAPKSAIDIISNVKNKISVKVELLGGENAAVIRWERRKEGKSVHKKKELKPP